MSDSRRADYLAVFVIVGILILIVLIISSFIIYLKVATVSSEVEDKLNKVDILVENLNSNLEGLKNTEQKLNEINNRISNLEKDLNNLTQKYPPIQTLNINNINQEELNRAINTKIETEFNTIQFKTNFNFWFNIIFGSLISITFVLYLIFGRKNENE